MTNAELSRQSRPVLDEGAETALLEDFLREVSPFSLLDRAQIREIVARLQPLTVQTGTDIIRQGEQGDACYLLRTGRAEVLLRDESGAERQMAVLDPGTLFGEAALLMDAPRNATVRAVEPCSLLALHRADLLETLESSVEMGRGMVELLQLRDRPQQAAGVEVLQRASADGTVITTLKDSNRMAFYRLSPEAYFVWERLDGAHNLRDLTLEYMAAYRVFAPQAISEVIEGLRASGFLTQSDLRREVLGGATVGPTHWERLTRLARRSIDWRVSLPNPDPMLSRLYSAGVRLLFTPFAQVALALLTIVGLVLFARDLANEEHAMVGDAWALLLFVVLYFLMVVLHESGHAFTVKHFGREVRRAGVGWYWYGPMAYADTSDMWPLDRRSRVLVTLAGLYTTALVASVATLLAVLLGHSVWGALAWQLAFISFYAVLVNLNPLLELDGYFVLMDYLDRPNLRDRCLAWLGRNLPGALRRPSVLRAHRLELSFGLAAVLYILLNAVLWLAVARLILQDWLTSAFPLAVAAAIAWLLTGTLVALTLLTLAGDVRASRRLPSRA